MVGENGTLKDGCGGIGEWWLRGVRIYSYFTTVARKCAGRVYIRVKDACICGGFPHLLLLFFSQLLHVCLYDRLPTLSLAPSLGTALGNMAQDLMTVSLYLFTPLDYALYFYKCGNEEYVCAGRGSKWGDARCRCLP